MKSAPELLLRVGVAFAFLYPAISAYFTPDSWIGYFPSFLLDAAAGKELLLLHVFGAVEIVIALWILSGKKIFLPSALATLMLIGIVVFNFSQMEVVFRDLAIATASAALAIRAYRTDPAIAFTTRRSNTEGTM